MRKLRTAPKLKVTKINRILVPFDFSEHSSNALRQAIYMAKCFMAEIDLIHIIAPVYATTKYTDIMPSTDIFYTKLLKATTANLKKVASEAGSNEGVKINSYCSLNVIHRGITEHAKKKKIDLIIMGTHGISGVSEFFAGSNAYRVVNESKCPVITVQKRTSTKGFKKILLPIRSEINSRQKVNFVATLAKTFMSKILIVGHIENSNKSEEMKVKNYVKQVETFLDRESISNETAFIKDEHFTKSILALAKKSKADLISEMTTHDFSLNQLISGTYSQQFVNHSKIPVLSIPNTLNFEYSYSNPLLGGMFS